MKKPILLSQARRLFQWRRRKLQHLADWQYSPPYWKLNQRWTSLRFYLNNLMFRVRFHQRTERESLAALISLFRSVIKPVLVAVFIIGGLELIEFLFLSYGGMVGRVIPVPHSVRTFISGWCREIGIDPRMYGSALSTFTQVAGTFLGLYFAAVSVVVSTVYAKVQGDVRSLMIRDKVSDRYLAVVTMLGAASALLLGAMALGRQPGVLAFIFIILLAVTAVYSFVALGLRIFYFFDPTKLVGYLTADLRMWIKEATPSGRWWQLSSFQAHYQQQAEEVLRTYHNIVYLANREEHLQSRALVDLASNAFSLLRYYARQKLSIPSESQWFRRTFKHPDWLTANDSSTRMALATGTALQPQVIPDLTWLEVEVQRTVAYTLRGLFERKDLMSAYSFAGSAQQTFGYMARQFAVDEALQLFRTLSPLIREQIHKVKADIVGQEGEVDELKVALGLTDTYGLGFINILLGLSERLRTTTGESLAQTVAAVDWEKLESLYGAGLPRSVVEQMEVLRIKLEFETEVEGRIVTPLWYRQQLVASSFVRYIESSVQNLVRDLEHVFAAEVESLVKARRYIFAAQLIERGLEACNKFSFHFEAAKACYESLSSLRKLQDIPWPEIDWEGYDKQIAKVRERLALAFSESLPGLANLPRSHQLPDYFGHAYTVAAEECYYAMANGNEALFSNIYPAFFRACLTAHERVRTSSDIFDLSVKMGMSAQFLIELFELSGCAIIFSELDDKPFWSVARKLWDEYLDRQSDGEAIIDYMLLMVEHKQGQFALFPRDVIQTTWKQDLARRLSERGLLHDPLSGYHDEDEDAVSMHPSPIVRAVAPSAWLFAEGVEVFIVVYLMEKYPEIKVDRIRRVDSLRGQIRRERQKSAGGELSHEE